MSDINGPIPSWKGLVGLKRGVKPTDSKGVGDNTESILQECRGISCKIPGDGPFRAKVSVIVNTSDTGVVSGEQIRKDIFSDEGAPLYRVTIDRNNDIEGFGLSCVCRPVDFNWELSANDVQKATIGFRQHPESTVETSNEVQIQQ